jgi:hypothetical protein
LKIIRLTPSQIHSQQHLSPILGFRPTGARLYIEKRIRLIGLAVEHPKEFQMLNIRLDTIDIRLNFVDRCLIIIGFRQLDEFSRFQEGRVYPLQLPYDGFQLRPFLTQRLGATPVAPDIRILQFSIDLFQSILLIIDVKDTP